jgi:hypothetical protein
MAQIDDIKKALKELAASDGAPVSAQQATRIISAFAPATREALQSKAYISLSAHVQATASSSTKGSDAASQLLSRQFLNSVTDALSDLTGDMASAGLCFLTALYQVNAAAASRIFSHDGVMKLIKELLETCQTGPVLLDAAHLIGQASGDKASRAVIGESIRSWINKRAHQTSDLDLCAASNTAMIKLQQGTSIDATDIAVASQASNASSTVSTLRSIIIRDVSITTASDAVEGLAYLSRDSDMAETVSADAELLKALFSKVPRKQSTTQVSDIPQATLIFGITTIIANLVAYRPRLSGERAQVEKIRRMANAGGSSGRLEEQTMPVSGDDTHVKRRSSRILAAGAADALVAAVWLIESKSTRLAAGRALLSIIENKDDRGKVLQSGGAKALMTIILDLMPKSKDQAAPVEVLDPIQALAKLAITASPMQVFGAGSGPLLNAIRPLSLLLTHQDANSLQRFEAMMALTNIASHGPDTSERISKAENVVSRIEMLLLDDHVLTRRAAVELLCNLIANAEDTFNRYTGANGSKSRLQVMVALADVDDVPTQLAASGALASITMSPKACQILSDLQLERHRVLAIFTSLINPQEGDPSILSPAHPGLVHRAVVCVYNLFKGIQDADVRKQVALEGESAGLVRALVSLIKGANAQDPAIAPILEPVATTLKILLSLGVTITV